MDQLFTKLDFDNPLLAGIIGFTLVSLIQYLETIYDDKKTISFKLSFAVFFIIFIIVYYVSNKHSKLNVSSQEIFTDMGKFN
jgi:hypothetical protein